MTTKPEQAGFLFDGKRIPFTQGQTVMEAVLEAGEYIPHLCFRQGLHPHGSCRLCVVECDGKLQASCAMQAAPTLRIASQTQELLKMRKHLIQMLFVEGNHICPSCEVSGNCQLQALAYELDMEEGHFHFRYPKREHDASHADVFLDRDRCINCELCVRASRVEDNKNVFSLGGRGTGTHLCANSPSGQLGETNLASDDSSAHVCPVGALILKDEAYTMPRDERLYIATPIHELGNKRPEDI